MTMPEFYILSYNEKIDLLYKEGVYIGKQKERHLTKVLYQLDSFYVEIYYKKYRQFINQVKCFTGTDRLDPYLLQIDVEDIIKYVD
jgi:hypothetical protein